MSSTRQLVDVGDFAPEFRLPSTHGEIAFVDYRGRRGTVLYFIREFGCMTCQMHALSLVKAHAQITESGFDVLVIGGGTETDASKMAQRIKAPFPILADRERSVYDRYGVDKALQIIQRSAAFVVDVDGRVSYAHRSTNPAAGLNLPDILEQVRQSSTATL